ncbi:MAG: monovalent cation/H+ antiporter subunit D family protein [candidate division WOR-3 bacterium]
MNLIPLFVIVPLAGAFVTYLVGSIFKKIADLFCDVLANLITAFLFAFAIVSLFKVAAEKNIIHFVGGWRPPIGITIFLDGAGIFLLIVVTGIGFLSSLFAIDYMKRYSAKYKFYALLLLMTAGMAGICITGDLFNMFVFIEISAIASYALVAFGTEHEELEAAFKYMVMGEIGSLMILLSIAIIYARTGTLNMADISQTVAANPERAAIVFPSILFIIGFAIKAALVPFHSWLPDAHPSAPAPISAMLSGVVIKVLGVYGLIRVFYNIIGVTPIISNILLVLAGLSMIIGVLLQLGQNDIKRLLAYCSISQIGYVLLGFGLGTPLGILGGFFHLINHAVFKAGLFLTSGAIEYATGTRDINKLGGLNKKMPWTSVFWYIGSFTASGVPPFAGFWSKLILIIAAILAKSYILAAIAAASAILALASFIRTQRRMLAGELPEALTGIKEIPLSMKTSLAVLTLLCIVLGLLLLPPVRANILDLAKDAVMVGTEYGRIVFEKAGLL